MIFHVGLSICTRELEICADIALFRGPWMEIFPQWRWRLLKKSPKRSLGMGLRIITSALQNIIPENIITISFYNKQMSYKYNNFPGRTFIFLKTQHNVKQYILFILFQKVSSKMKFILKIMFYNFYVDGICAETHRDL